MEFVNGAIVGIVQTLVGFPFDTLKTRRQTYPNSPLSFHFLYRGVRYRMISSSLITSNNFGIASYVHSKGFSWWFGGGVAGFVSSFLLAPLEIRKINRQVSIQGNKPFLSSFVFSPLKIRKVDQQVYLKGNIPVRAPYLRGLWLTIIRESPAHLFFFGVYHAAKEYQLHPLFGGALAGLSSWTLTYPIDVVKSRMLADPTLSLKEAIEMRHFWRGYSFAATRAIIANSLAFWMYENLYLFHSIHR